MPPFLFRKLCLDGSRWQARVLRCSSDISVPRGARAVIASIPVFHHCVVEIRSVVIKTGKNVSSGTGFLGKRPRRIESTGPYQGECGSASMHGLHRYDFGGSALGYNAPRFPAPGYVSLPSVPVPGTHPVLP